MRNFVLFVKVKLGFLLFPDENLGSLIMATVASTPLNNTNIGMLKLFWKDLQNVIQKMKSSFSLCERCQVLTS